MRKLTPILGVFALVAAVVWIPAPPAAAQASSIESQLLSLVNSVRSQRLLAHSGLHATARGHSRSMAARGGLTHSGAQSRIEHATPDPAESNGAPDDGFTGAWCENTGYVSGAPTGEVAEQIHQGWQRSASHRACVADADMTAVGIGLYFDGETWWATMEAMEDLTLPGSASAQLEPSTPEPSTPEPEPVAELLSEPAPTPTPEAEPAQTAAVVTAAPRPEATVEGISRASGNRPSSFGQPEALAGLGIAAVLVLAIRRLVRAASGSGTR